jgi:hypothetical protein
MKEGKSMHSRIIELSEHPIDPDDYLTDFRVPEWFTSSIADYVDSSTDRTHDIEWFLSAFNGCCNYSPSDQSIVFTPDAKVEFFSDYFKVFQQTAALLSTATLNEFSGMVDFTDLDMSVYKLRSAYDDQFGLYVFIEEDCLRTLHDWLRGADISKRYYIGGTVDYHF